MSNSEKKQELWKALKQDFLNAIPEKYTVDVNGLDDETPYFHPFINIDEVSKITSQCDLNNNKIYAFRFVKNSFSVYFENLELLQEFLENFDYLEPIANEAILKQIGLNDIKNKIENMQHDLQYHFYTESLQRKKEKKSKEQIKRDLLSLIDLLENNRLI